MEEKIPGSSFTSVLDLMVIFTVVAVFGAKAFSAPLPAMKAARADACQADWQEILYSATFNWPLATTGKTAPLRLEIGTLKSSAPVKKAKKRTRPTMFARIVTPGSNRCEALCQVKSLEKTGPLEPVSLDLACRGAHLASLTSPATIFWSGAPAGSLASDAAPVQFPTVRFGTWLGGYQLAFLRVEYDAYSQARRSAKRVARQ
jgi:hypothetical protein